MPRPRERFRLEDGLPLKIHNLIRHRIIVPGHAVRDSFIQWRTVGRGESVLHGYIDADLTGDTAGVLCIRAGKIDQTLRLRRQPRNFGGGQWYFLCPITNRRASVLWLLPGLNYFASRHAFRNIAYGSQFEPAYDRALENVRKIRRRLSSDPADWAYDSCPPDKPKGMHWRTYDGLIAECAVHEDTIEATLTRFLGRLRRSRGTSNATPGKTAKAAKI